MTPTSRIPRFVLVLCLTITFSTPSILGTPAEQFTTQTKLVDHNEIKVGTYGVGIDIDGDTAVVTGLGNPLTGVLGKAFIYVRNGSTWTLQQTVSDQDNVPAQDDAYGVSVAVNGDTLVVGATLDSSAGFVHGAAYVYLRNGTTWSLQQKLTAADVAPFTSFGGSVDVLGDTIVVGASPANAAYVFNRNGGVWTQTQKLVPSGPAGQAFGVSVSISGQTIAVGDPTFSAPGANFCGAIYAFVNDGSLWVLQQQFTSHGVASDQALGSTVAISGHTIVASAPGESVGAHTKGAAYIFERTGTVWDQKKRVIERAGGKLDSYGTRVAVDGDTVVIGNINDSTVAQFAGAGEVYVRNGNQGWSLKYTLTANDGQFLDVLGSTVAISGNTILLGALQPVSGPGAVYIYE